MSKKVTLKDIQKENATTKLIQDNNKTKGMGTTFWVLTGLCIASVIFIITVIIVRNL